MDKISQTMTKEERKKIKSAEVERGEEGERGREAEKGERACLDNWLGKEIEGLRRSS